MAAPKTKQFATTVEVVEIVNALNAFCKKGDDGMAIYSDNMTDDRVVDEIVLPALAKGGAVDQSRRHPILQRTTKIRSEVFGAIRRPSKDEDRIKALEDRLSVIEADLAKLIDNTNRFVRVK